MTKNKLVNNNESFSLLFIFKTRINLSSPLKSDKSIVRTRRAVVVKA
jgi:hypothetical protein